MTQDERFALYLLHSIEDAPWPLKSMLESFPLAKDLIGAEPSDWQAYGLSPSFIKKLSALKAQGEIYATLAASYEEAKKAGFKFLAGEEISSLFISLDSRERPLGIWIHGDENVLWGSWPRVAIVGTRRPTFYGRSVARDFAFTLGQLKSIVVSGLARGIDTAAHESALETGGKTVAVLGTGLNAAYPPENKKLQREIIPSHGVVITEFPLHIGPDARNFPRRNRLISALSFAVIVIEGDKKSGALITARWAANQGKDVFAVPGPIDSPMSQGPNRLIREGAIPLTSREDLIESLSEIKTLARSLTMKKETPPLAENASAELSDPAKKILGLLSRRPISLEAILSATGFELQEANSLLLELELNGFIHNCLPYGYAKEPTHC